MRAPTLLFDEMRRIRPDIRIILFGGTPEELPRREFARVGLAGFLRKAFGLMDFIEKMREILGEEAEGGERQASAGD